MSCIIEKTYKITSNMQKTSSIIDIFVNVVDNYGDMGFACEFILACQRGLGEECEYSIWTNDTHKVHRFV